MFFIRQKSTLLWGYSYFGCLVEFLSLIELYQTEILSQCFTSEKYLFCASECVFVWLCVHISINSRKYIYLVLSDWLYFFLLPEVEKSFICLIFKEFKDSGKHDPKGNRKEYGIERHNQSIIKVLSQYMSREKF